MHYGGVGRLSRDRVGQWTRTWTSPRMDPWGRVTVDQGIRIHIVHYLRRSLMPRISMMVCSTNSLSTAAARLVLRLRRDPEIREQELQDPELQGPELQDPELQDPELRDPELQDPELQDPEL